MRRCFIIQPFDNGKFDKRFDDTIEPAIEEAELKPYRVDRGPAATIPINEIENKIKESEICLAEITTDNPNVWFELGFALASKKDVILICSDERTSKYPFDVHHRKIIKYKTESQSDFEKLGGSITTTAKALIKKRKKINQLSISSPICKTVGLSQHEMVVLVAIAENMDHPKDWVDISTIRNYMEKAGFRKIAVRIALCKLLDNEYVSYSEQPFDDGYGNFVDTETNYQTTPKGMDWLMHNENKLILKENQNSSCRDDLALQEDIEIPF